MSDNKGEESKSHTLASMPKHVPFPDFGGNNEMLNELIMFLFTACTAALQFINIYRTNWWLPQTNINYIINLYNIEPFLIILILAMTSRRLLYCLFIKVMERPCSSQHQQWKNLTKMIIEDIILALLAVCLAIMCSNQNNLSIFVLLYLFVMYYLIFGPRIEPFLRFSYKVKGAYFNGLPLHSCSSNPMAVRDEVDILRNDFNNRLKQVIFTAVFNAYYAGFLPCFFAHSMFYNVGQCIQHVIFVLLSMLTMGIVCNFPSRYSDILHRASLHLGHWCKLELKPGTDNVDGAAASNWNKATLWPHDSVVKHAGDFYRCQGPVTVASPTNLAHARFYKLFQNPASIYSVLAAIQGTIILAGMTLIYYTVEWHFILSLSFITLTNNFTFFILLRDYFITKAVYQGEILVTESKTPDVQK